MHKSSYDGMAKMLEKHLGLYCVPVEEFQKCLSM